MKTPNTIATRNGRIEWNGKDEYLTYTINGSNTCVKVGTKEYLVKVDDLKNVGGKFQPFFTIKSSDEKLIAWASKQGYRVAKSKKGYVVKGTSNNTLAQFRKMCLFLSYGNYNIISIRMILEHGTATLDGEHVNDIMLDLRNNNSVLTEDLRRLARRKGTRTETPWNYYE
jgi:hypothetical protein